MNGSFVVLEEGRIDISPSLSFSTTLASFLSRETILGADYASAEKADPLLTTRCVGDASSVPEAASA